LATILPYVRANTFSIFGGKSSPYIALGLTSCDVLTFLESISRNPVPKIVRDKLFSTAEEKSLVLGAVAPDFVISGASQESAKAVLEELGGQRFFAVEIAKGVWGFFDRYVSPSPNSIDVFQVGGSRGRGRELSRVTKNLSKRGFKVESDISALNSIGTLPVVGRCDGYRRGGLNKPSLEPFSRFCEFFDLKPNDPDWENEKIGVEIFSLVPQEVRSTRAFEVAMAPCRQIMTTPMNCL
jgi:hypothetical protein